MARLGKCTECRRRKIKCDEVHPCCGRCNTGKRDCRYPRAELASRAPNQLVWEINGIDMSGCVTHPKGIPDEPAESCDDSSHATNHSKTVLSLRSIRKLGDGENLLHTFVLASATHDFSAHTSTQVKKPGDGDPISHTNPELSFPKEPTAPDGLLTSRWISIVENITKGFDTRSVWGDWMDLVPVRIGTSKAIYWAAESFLSSITAHFNPTEANIAARVRSNSKALQSMRAALLVDNAPQPLEHLVLAVILLHLGEVCASSYSGGHRYHQIALLNLVVRLPQTKDRCSELLRRVYYHCAHWDTDPAILECRDSRFDTPEWGDIPFVGYASLNVAVAPLNFVHEYNITHRVKFPRLMRLIREASNSPHDTIAGAAATKLASELLVDLEPWVQYIKESGLIHVAPNASATYRLFVPNSYNFDSFLVHGAFVEYWVTRIITCRLILVLVSTMPTMVFDTQFDIGALILESTRAAEEIMMCTEYSLAVDKAIPMTALRQIFPLQLAQRVWYSQEMKLNGTGDSNVEYAVLMQECCDQMISDIWKRYSGRQ